MLLKCPNCEYDVSVSNVRYTLTYGKFHIDKLCPNCGVALIEEEDVFFGSKEVKPFEVSRWDSMSVKEKKQVIKDRAKRHYNNNDKKEVEHQRSETIKQIKQKFEKGKRS